MSEYLALREEIKRLQARAREAAKVYFHEQSGALFQQHPILAAFAWTQYTPYFNDGDPCVFSARTADPFVGFTDDADADDFLHHWDRRYSLIAWSDEANAYRAVSGQEAHVAAFDAVEAFLRQFDEDDLAAMFGDHTKIIVYPNAIVQEDYAHD